MNWADSVVPEEEQWIPFYYEEDINNISNEQNEKAPFLKQNDVLLDLGCGDGRIIIESLLQTQCNEAYGIDIEPEAISQAKSHYKESKLTKPITFICDDFFKTNQIPWNKITVVVMYLLPSVMDKLYPLLKSKLSHCRIFCACFKMSSNIPKTIIRSSSFPDFIEIKL
ncbi:ribosomal protein L11 methyltransferase, putative [Entamoeba histolytica HM-1:IMSS-B]|uniref:Ribosomal protein L11 methyltransferase, putative n=1 Tax=Entamoeba histolytica HM-1:IMSS-B TaxID=885319 RepID=M3TUB4_ENTH1|nr:ribosomal protein L11 methyltransferase, putative [Entamoeba histolytica HM-1:IMSS-B]